MQPGSQGLCSSWRREIFGTRSSLHVDFSFFFFHCCSKKSGLTSKGNKRHWEERYNPRQNYLRMFFRECALPYAAKLFPNQQLYPEKTPSPGHHCFLDAWGGGGGRKESLWLWCLGKCSQSMHFIESFVQVVASCCLVASMLKPICWSLFGLRKIKNNPLADRTCAYWQWIVCTLVTIQRDQALCSDTS